MPSKPDFLVVGAGVVGITIARELRRRHPDCGVTVIDKEAGPGEHASGRNSGVLHAGFYYTADSLKARFCREGNAELTAFCVERGLPINRCGKLVVARTEEDLASLDELARRAAANGVDVSTIGADRAREIEPRVRTVDRALWSPTTSTVNPARVLGALADDARGAGVRFAYSTSYRVGMEAGYVVNAAGLYADRIAHGRGFGEGLTILPFKGLYLYSDEPEGAVRTNVYPVPDLRNPFLGVHFTVTVDGHAKIGPTAIPCLWREQYGGRGARLDEMVAITGLEIGLMLRAGFDFRRLALEEMRKYRPGAMARLAAELMEGVRPEDYRRWGRPGIRAQLIDRRTRKLLSDFVLQGDSRSLHVLNAVSPAFTCSLPFARHVCDELGRLVG